MLMFNYSFNFFLHFQDLSEVKSNFNLMPWPSPATFNKLKKVKVNKGMMMKKELQWSISIKI